MSITMRMITLQSWKGITGKLIGDKGYISKKLFAKLFEQKITLITQIKKNMKNILMDTRDKMMCRNLIETVFSVTEYLNSQQTQIAN